MVIVDNLKRGVVLVLASLLLAVGIGATTEQAYAVELPSIEVTRVYGGSGAAVKMYQNKIRQWKAVNDDVVGFINIPQTNIQYPLVQADRVVCSTHGQYDNCYYLNRNIYKQIVSGYNESAIFVDVNANGLNRNLLSKNTLIYGHNWNNIEKNRETPRIGDPTDTMFGQLPAFGDYNFASGNPYFTIETEDDSMTFLIYAVNYVDAKSVYFWNCNPTDYEHQSLINYLKQTSVHDYHVPVDYTDKTVILQACTYKYQQDGYGRFLVCGRLLRDGESVYDYPVVTMKS